jgi:CMP/dCMP kinase
MKILKKDLHIAIDGPISVGKSSLSFLLAKKLNVLYVYTGAMYRTVAWLALVNKIDFFNQDKLFKLTKKFQIKFEKPSNPERYTDVLLNKENITSKLFTHEVSKVVAYISQHKKIRNYLVNLQKKLAKNKAVVMEGRDIGTKVLPKADLKIFLTADFDTRAKRRWLQLKEINKPISLKAVKQRIKKRDYYDKHRKESPLRKAKDAWILKTTNLTISQTVEVVLEKLKEKKLVE